MAMCTASSMITIAEALVVPGASSLPAADSPRAQPAAAGCAMKNWRAGVRNGGRPRRASGGGYGWMFSAYILKADKGATWIFSKRNSGKVGEEPGIF